MSSLPNFSHASEHDDIFSMDDVARQLPAAKEKRKPFIIGVAGGTASGKTTVCEKIIEQLRDKRATIISQDCFYRGLTPDQIESVASYNFDHPNAFDFDLMISTLKQLCEDGGTVTIPVYDFKTHQRSTTAFTKISGAEVIIFEGILAFHSPELNAMYDMKLFVDTDDDTRLIRRIRRDTADRGRDLMGVLAQYERFVKPAYDQYIHSSKKYADIIIPRGGDNVVAIDMLVKHIKGMLEERASPRSGQSRPLYLSAARFK